MYSFLLIVLLIAQTACSMESNKQFIKNKVVLNYQVPSKSEFRSLKLRIQPFTEACKLIVGQTVMTVGVEENCAELSYNYIRVPGCDTLMYLPENVKEEVGVKIYALYNSKKRLRTFVSKKMSQMLEREIKNNCAQTNQQQLMDNTLNSLHSLPKKLRNQATAKFMEKHGNIKLWKTLAVQQLNLCKKCPLCTQKRELYALISYGSRLKILHKKSLCLTEKLSSNDYSCINESNNPVFYGKIITLSRDNVTFKFEMHNRKYVYLLDNDYFCMGYNNRKSIELPDNWLSSNKESNPNEIESMIKRFRLLILPNNNLVIIRMPEDQNKPIDYIHIGTTIEAVIDLYCEAVQEGEG